MCYCALCASAQNVEVANFIKYMLVHYLSVSLLSKFIIFLIQTIVFRHPWNQVHYV